MQYRVKKTGKRMWYMRTEREKNLPPVYFWTEVEERGKVFDSLKDARRAAEAVPRAKW